jgi:hypothetical protein
MKLGAENRKEIILLVVLLLLVGISLGRLVLNWTKTSAAPPASAAPVPAGPPARHVRRRNTANAAVLAPSNDPRLRLDLLKASEDMKYEGTERNIFRDYEPPIPPPIAPAMKDAGCPKGGCPPPGPPPPPPINLKFFGFANRSGESKRIFLAQGDDVFIAGEGEIVDRRYKVVQIQPNAVEIEDVLNNNRQTIPLTQS